MAIKLNNQAIAHAEKLIKANEVEHAASWAENKPTKDEEARFLNTHSLEEYGEWFLGVDTDAEKNSSKEKYSYLVGDLNEIYLSALKEIEKNARGANQHDIAKAAQNLIALAERSKK
jgi:viroplasmin and RNaseH domain-containing protein